MIKNETELGQEISRATAALLEKYDKDWRWCYSAADEIAEKVVEVVERHLVLRLLGDFNIKITS